MDKNSEKYDYGYQQESKARGLGTYVGRAYSPEIKTICKVNGFELRVVGTRYEILWDGELLNRYPSLKEAEVFFIDFADLTRGKYNKLKAAA